LSESIYLGVSRVSEFDRFGVHVATAATSTDTLGKIEIVDVAGSGALCEFQPAGPRVEVPDHRLSTKARRRSRRSVAPSDASRRCRTETAR